MDHAPADHPNLPAPRIGVLLINLGTPEGTDTGSVRRYLREFLSDRRVIEANPLLWQLILNAVILPFRPRRSAEAYAQIWNVARDESPLKTITRAQSDALAAAIGGDHPEVVVDWAMRYGSPSTASRIEALHAAGCQRILLFALYPQYSAATTATAYDKAFDQLKTMRWQPAVRTAPAYHDDPGYVSALAASVTLHLATLDWQPDTILASFHGLPKIYCDQGDPYRCHCAKTARLLRQTLGLDEARLQLTYQSRFGPREWLQPYTDVTLAALPAAGITKVAVITPGFAADCVETLEEIGIRGRETFLAAGGTHFTAIPCLNASLPHIDALAALVRRELAGWI
ncbi:MAG: ferrochelatase [Alphaproteobacteria bacterium]